MEIDELGVICKTISEGWPRQVPGYVSMNPFLSTVGAIDLNLSHTTSNIGTV